MSNDPTPYEHAFPANPQVDDRPPSVNTRIEGKNVRRLINTSGAHELRAIAHALEDQREAWRERALKAEEARSLPPQEESAAEGEEVCAHCGRVTNAVCPVDGIPIHAWVPRSCGHHEYEARSESPRTPESPAPSEAVTVSRVGLPTDAVTRVEVVGDGGRLLVKRPVSDVSVELQDGGRTLKVFLREPVEPTTVGPFTPLVLDPDHPLSLRMERETASSGDGESPASETAHEKSVRDGAQRVAQRIADRLGAQARQESPVSEGWERIREGTDGPGGEPIAVWVNVRAGKIAPIRLSVEQAISRAAEEAAMAAYAEGHDMHCEAEERATQLETALRGWILACDTSACPHGNSARYPSSAWFCDGCVEAARDALAESRQAAPQQGGE